MGDTATSFSSIFKASVAVSYPKCWPPDIHVLYCKGVVTCQWLYTVTWSYSIPVSSLHLPSSFFASPFLQASRDQLSGRLPCSPACQPVPHNLTSYLMSYSLERMFILRKKEVHSFIWTFGNNYIYSVSSSSSILSSSKRRQAVKDACALWFSVWSHSV